MADNSITLEELGQRLRVLRQIRRLRQRDVEDELRLPRGLLTHYERASRSIRCIHLVRLVAFLGSPEYLFGFAQAPGQCLGEPRGATS